jgi:hypothetical protein
MQGTEVNHDDEIRQLAYGIWQQEGCPDGCDVDHWFKAKMIWEETNLPQSETKQSKGLKKRRSRKIPAAETEL